MVILLIILVVACLVWLFHPRFNPQFTEPKPKDADHPPNLSRKEATIMGKSKFVLRQPQPTKATESQTDKGVDKDITFDPSKEKLSDPQVPKEELHKSFSDTPEAEELNDPLEVDVEQEFNDQQDDTDLDEEAEEIRQIFENDVAFGDGVGYDDLDGANKVALADNPSPEEQEQAGAVFCQLQPTDAFEQLIAGNVEKEDKVKELMAMHLKKHYEATEKPEVVKRDLSGFLN